MPRKKTTTTTTDETKTVKKPAAKKATAKETKPTDKVVKAAKAEKKETKAPAKKTTVKKTSTVADKKVEAKPVVKEEAKAETKAPAKKAATKKSAAKTTTKKTTTKKEETKKSETKPAAKKAPAKKAVTKKSEETKPAVKKTSKTVKLEQYNNFSLDTCIDMAKAMGVDMGYDQYAGKLLENADMKAIVKEINEAYDLKNKKFSFDEDGYDADLIDVLVNKVAETVDIKASDFVLMSEQANAYLQYQLSDDATANNDEYHKEFDLVKRILMIAQRKDIHTMQDLKNLVKVDMKDMIVHYMDVAYGVMKNWQYDDVKYYENFIYAVLSQFTDLHEALSNRAMMDVADLYIEHGDYALGDSNYGYVIRENNIKDYIYYRFANIYVNIDREKARSIAQSSLQYVDDRYTYYPNIIKILED